MADMRNSTSSRCVAHAADTADPGAGNRFRNCASALEGCALPTKLFPRVRQSTNVRNRHEWPARYLSFVDGCTWAGCRPKAAKMIVTRTNSCYCFVQGT